MNQLVPFRELTKELGRGQKSYILYRLMGFDEKDAIKMASRTDQTVALWRQQDEDYIKVEGIILRHSKHYADEVFGGTVEVAVTMLLEHLKYIIQNSVINWDKLRQDEKRDFKWASDVLIKCRPRYTQVSKRTYDDMILEQMEQRRDEDVP